MALNKKRTSVRVSPEDTEVYLNLKYEDITSSFIMNTFGEIANKGRKYNPYDLIDIPARGYYYYLSDEDNDKNKMYNKQPFTTTLGKWIFNLYFVRSDPSISKILKWVDADLTSKMFEDIMDKLGYALMEDELPVKAYKKFVMRPQFFMPFVSILSPCYTVDMLTVSKAINKRKAQLLKEHKEAIDNQDIVVFDKISNELLDYARDLLKDDPAMDLYNSGARGSFGNNFKNMFVMRGAVKNPDPTKGYSMITSNFIDGVSRDEYAAFANTLAAGPYARSRKTMEGGYWEKLFMAALQHLKLIPGVDCGTKRTIKVKVTKKNIKDIMYCFAVVNGKPVEITSKNKDQFIGKEIRLRYSSLCEHKDGICEVCAGRVFTKLGITNIGTTTPQLASKLKLKSMKLFHDDQINLTEMDPMHAFSMD